jgi:hypothetical protein
VEWLVVPSVGMKCGFLEVPRWVVHIFEGIYGTMEIGIHELPPN